MPILLWLLLAATNPPTQDVQPAPAAQATTVPSPAVPSPLTVSSDRIARALAQEPVIRPEGGPPVFRVEVFGRKPTIFDFIGTDVLKGPVPRGSSAHQEFLESVTPEDVQGYATFSNREGAVVAATSLGNALIFKALLESFRQVRATLRRHAEQEAHDEVVAALAELQRTRARAGLQPK